MTKYILHGGNSREKNDLNLSFYREIVLSTNSHNPTISLCYFSREDNEIETCSQQDQSQFSDCQSTNKINFVIANKKDFISQIKKSNAIYFRGGNTHKLVSTIQSFPKMETYFTNKVIAGSSAGAYLLSKYYYENDDGKFGTGIGTLNIKTFCHYTSDQKENLNKLINYRETLPTIVLANHQWIVLNK
jgi:peptidase E